MKGLINLNKASGISSAAAVSKVRRALNIKAVGHMGTLDPMASGVLLIGVGKATRLFDYFLKKDKRYDAVFEFGKITDTLDSTGSITGVSDVIPSESEIESVLSEFHGNQLQVPPLYSAKSVNGKRAYKIAREGGEVELAPVNVQIYDIKLVKRESSSSFRFNIHCSSGTYIRSIARDLAARLDTLGIMTELTRTSCGSFLLNEAVTVEQLSEQKQECLINIDEALGGMPRLDLDETYYKPILNGIKIKNTFIDEESFLLYVEGEFFGIASTDEQGYIRIGTYLKD